MVWVGMLALAQIADLVTTEVDRLGGGVETNQFAAFILMVGGAGLFLLLKLTVVAGMAVAVVISSRYRQNHPGERAERCLAVAARARKAKAVLLTGPAVDNAHVSTQTAASESGPTQT